MKGLTFTRLALYACILAFNLPGSFAQTVEIIYKQRLGSNYSADISFSDRNGLVNPDVKEILDDSHIHFVITINVHSQRDHFRYSDFEDFVNINLKQEGVIIPRLGKLEPLDEDNRGRFTRILLTYDRDDVKMHKPFFFTHELDSTSAIRVSEEFYPHYSHYKEIYDNAMILQNERNFIEAFDNLMLIVKDTEEVNEISYYSFTKDATETRMQSILRSYAEKKQLMHDSLSQKYENNLLREFMLRADSLKNVYKQNLERFNSYFEFDYPNAHLLKNELADIRDGIKLQNEANRELFKQHNFAFFGTGQYLNNVQFTFYIDLISRLVSHIEYYQILGSLDTLNLENLDELPLPRQRLIETGWYEDFKLKVSLINENIIEYGYVFDNDIMRRLSMMTNYQPQPYYEILMAFNSKSGAYSDFNRFLNNAMIICSDEDLVQNIEMWILCYDFTTKNISPIIINSINDGVEFVRQGRWNEVEQAFSTITMQADNLATPWFYFALSDLNQDNEFAAMAKIENALNRYPRYVFPRLLLFQRMYDRGFYDELLSEISESVKTVDIFLFRYWKAKILLAMDKPREAIRQIEQYCHELNEYDIMSWFLLGDAYLADNNRAKAQQAYRHTQTLNARDYAEMFESRMRRMHNNRSEEE